MRDLDLLDVLGGPEAARQDGLGVLRVAELVGRDKGAVSRALATLAEAGVLSRDPDRRTYRLGPRLFALAARSEEATLVHRARPVLQLVVAQVQETAHLCVLRGTSVLTLLSETAPREVATSAWAGLATPALRTPSGRVLVSDWPRAVVDAWWATCGNATPAAPDGPFPVLSEPREPAAQDLPALHAGIELIRRRGYAVSEEELESGVVAASAPVRDAAGAVVAALDVSAPAARLRSRLPELGEHVARSAARVSAALGHDASRSRPL